MARDEKADITKEYTDLRRLKGIDMSEIRCPECNYKKIDSIWTSEKTFTASEVNALLDKQVEAKLACKDIYLNIHVSEIKKHPKSIQRAWEIGQRIYAKLTINGDV